MNSLRIPASCTTRGAAKHASQWVELPGEREPLGGAAPLLCPCNMLNELPVPPWTASTSSFWLTLFQTAPSCEGTQVGAVPPIREAIG